MRGVCLVGVVLALFAAASVHAGTPSEWKRRTIYQLLTDRFNNPSDASCSNLNDYCGGTFAGVKAQLPYITGMGFDAVWISPVVQNSPQGYHGYWAQDLYAINSNFGTKQDLLDLLQACHAANVWVMLDVVANHMAWNVPINQLQPFNTSTYYHDCNGCPSSCNIENFQDQPQVEHCKLSGLPDLNQTHTDVATTLNSWIKDIVSTYGFDGIRVDTTAEVHMSFWKTFNAAAGVYAVGEVDSGNTAYVGPYQGGALDATLSYPFFYTLRNVFAQQQSMNQIQSQLAAYAKYFSDPTILATFADNHDNPRFLSQQADTKLYQAALVYVLLSEGIPIVYYGTEQQLNGGSPPASREPLWPTHFDTSSALYTWLAKVVAFRKSATVWNAPQTQSYSDDSFYAFSRGTSAFVALTNAGSGGDEQTRTITYHPFSDGTKLCNLFYPTQDCITIANGQFKVNLLAGESKVYYPTSSSGAV